MDGLRQASEADLLTSRKQTTARMEKQQAQDFGKAHATASTFGERVLLSVQRADCFSPPECPVQQPRHVQPPCVASPVRKPTSSSHTRAVAFGQAWRATGFPSIRHGHCCADVGQGWTYGHDFCCNFTVIKRRRKKTREAVAVPLQAANAELLVVGASGA